VQHGCHIAPPAAIVIAAGCICFTAPRVGLSLEGDPIVKVSLLYHEDAGEGVLAEQLRHWLERAGHQLAHMVEDDAVLERVAEDCDLVVAAGGDGTVWRGVRAVSGTRTPLAILPLGTANNIARSLGIGGSVPELIRGWSSATLRPLDMGMARGAWGESGFVEAVGGGLIPHGIAAMERQPEPEEEDAAARLARAVRTYRDVLRDLTARPWRLSIDGQRTDGEFLMVEVLNIRSVGPNLVLSPGADPSDSVFDVVTAGEEHRDEIEQYLRDRSTGGSGRLALPRRRARRVEVDGWEEMHLDDQVCSGPAFSSVSVEIVPAALQLLR
jgi:diacylglycerol kinase family enzyme